MKVGQFPTGYTRKVLGVEDAEKDGITGKGIRLAVCDTGLATSHQLRVGDAITASVKAQDFGNVDDSGHGTWCNNSIKGPEYEVAKGWVLKGMALDVELISIRTLFTPAGAGNNSDVLKAVEMAVEQFNANVISMSLGSESATPEGDPIQAMIQEYSKRGVVFVLAAGNSGEKGPGTINSPGDVEEAVTVGSISIQDAKRSYYSSMGPTVDGRIKPDVACLGGGRADKTLKPSESIISSSAGMIDMLDYIPDKVASIQGTSMATPQCAGIIALWMEYANKHLGISMTESEIKKILSAHATSKDNELGWGLINYNMIKM